MEVLGGMEAEEAKEKVPDLQQEYYTVLRVWV